MISLVLESHPVKTTIKQTNELTYKLGVDDATCDKFEVDVKHKFCTSLVGDNRTTDPKRKN